MLNETSTCTKYILNPTIIKERRKDNLGKEGLYKYALLMVINTNKKKKIL